MLTKITTIVRQAIFVFANGRFMNYETDLTVNKYRRFLTIFLFLPVFVRFFFFFFFKFCLVVHQYCCDIHYKTRTKESRFIYLFVCF